MGLVTLRALTHGAAADELLADALANRWRCAELPHSPAIGVHAMRSLGAGKRRGGLC